MHGEACSMWRLFKRQGSDGGWQASLVWRGVARIGVNIEGGWASKSPPQWHPREKFAAKCFGGLEQRDSVLVEKWKPNAMPSATFGKNKGCELVGVSRQDEEEKLFLRVTKS
ncbi:hypothetical protein CDAR_460251 [Caerostris darwini]|uniref:Uncharacterized protein n=1 Tax=Caerostris darwini TaxID=1538125 RepID=A0AAV4RA05_9ARAC|nr:hypothetical protein CDAR_460251 [Caerostris darwini]